MNKRQFKKHIKRDYYRYEFVFEWLDIHYADKQSKKMRYINLFKAL